MVARKLVDLNKNRDRRRPAEQDSLPRRQIRKLAEQAAEIVGNEPPHELLVSIVHDAVQEERVALGKGRLRQLRRPLRGKDETESELTPLAGDPLECLATHLRSGCPAPSTFAALDE